MTRLEPLRLSVKFDCPSIVILGELVGHANAIESCPNQWLGFGSTGVHLHLFLGHNCSAVAVLIQGPQPPWFLLCLFAVPFYRLIELRLRTQTTQQFRANLID